MLESKNFFVSILTLVALFFGYFGVDIPNSPDVIAASGAGLSFGAFFTAVLLPNFFSPVIKIISNWKTNGFNLHFLTSANFWTQFTTTILLSIQIFTPLTSFWITLIINILNFVYHLIETAMATKPIPAVLGR